MSFEHLILSWLTLQTDTEIHLRDKKYSTVLFAYFRLPSWTEKVFYPGSEMEKLAAYSFSMQTNKKLQARLKAGFLIREMLQHFTMKANSTLTPDRSMWIYSAHDKTVANLLNALGLFEVYSIFYFISILELQILELQIKSCFDCSLRTFQPMLRAFLWSFTNPTMNITLRFFTKEIVAKM